MAAAVASAAEGPAPPALATVPLPETRKNAIYFFGTQGPPGQLSNFAVSPFKINGVSWRTVEHYYHAQKFVGSDVETAIREATDPAEARQLAKEHENDVRKDWSELKEKAMFAALLAKFSQHPQSVNTLIDTKNAFLVSHEKKDAYWGDGHSADGLNRLGVLLMEVRQMVRAELGLPEPEGDYISEEKEKKEKLALEKLMEQLMEKSDAIDEGIIESSVQPSRTKRKIRTHPGTASKPFRSLDGTPLFERDAETGKIAVLDDADGILISPAALTPAARTVAFLYQFEKRNRREANMLEPEQVEAMEDEMDEEEDWALAEEYAPPPATVSLDEVVNENAIEILLEETEMILAMAATLEDHTGDDFLALSVQLRTLSNELQKHVHRKHTEKTLDRVLQTISSIDTLISA